MLNDTGIPDIDKLYRMRVKAMDAKRRIVQKSQKNREITFLIVAWIVVMVFFGTLMKLGCVDTVGDNSPPDRFLFPQGKREVGAK